jgi:hypothetical protein
VPALPDYFGRNPRLQETAKLLRLPVNDLQAHLRNQGLYVGEDERIPEGIVFASLEREIAERRPFAPVPLHRAR